VVAESLYQFKQTIMNLMRMIIHIRMIPMPLMTTNICPTEE
jgi:hypothetical protein